MKEYEIKFSLIKNAMVRGTDSCQEGPTCVISARPLNTLPLTLTLLLHPRTSPPLTDCLHDVEHHVLNITGRSVASTIVPKLRLILPPEFLV